MQLNGQHSSHPKRIATPCVRFTSHSPLSLALAIKFHQKVLMYYNRRPNARLLESLPVKLNGSLSVDLSWFMIILTKEH